MRVIVSTCNTFNKSAVRLGTPKGYTLLPCGSVAHRGGGFQKVCNMKCYPLFSPEDSDLRPFKWRVDTQGYAIATIPGPAKQITVRAHVLVIERMLGRPRNPGECADHINGNKLDMRRPNLRPTTRAGNSQNRTCSQWRGTTWNKSSQKWQAAVGYNGRTFYLGVFSDRQEAAHRAAEKRSELRFLTGCPIISGGAK